MISKDSRPNDDAADLRMRAEKIARDNGGRMPENQAQLSENEIKSLIRELRVHQIELEIQNDELLRAKMELEASRDRYLNFYERAPVGYFTLSEKGLILEANITSATLLGVARSEMVQHPISPFIHQEDLDVFCLSFNQLLKTRQPQTCEIRMIKTDGALFWAHLESTCEQNSGGAPAYNIVMSDITGRKYLEDEYELTASLITLINTQGDLHERMSDLTASLQCWAGCEAVGIRLKSGDDYPYYESRGFPPEFVQAEKYLCAYGPDGKIMRDGQGNPVLECMCGNILCGRFDPVKSFFTNHGSFWSNNTTALLASSTEADRQGSTRNRCNGMGYESVALIPIRAGEQVLGLIQFNDHRPNRFTPDLIDHFERMADILAIALSQRQSEESLRESEAQFRTIFEVASVGIVQVDPINGRILQCNETYCQITGYPRSELLEISFPEITHFEDRQRDWEIFSRAMKGEIPAYYNEKRYIRKDGSTIWVRMNAAFIRDANGQAIRSVAVCEDITERKQTEQFLETARNEAINKKKQLEAVMEALPVGIAIVDESGGTVRSNQIYEELWGSPRPPTEDVGDYEAYKAWWLDTGKPVQPDEWASARATLKGESVFGQMMEIESFDGVRKIVMNSAAPVRDANGGIVGCAVAIHDITNIKNIEREVVARASELEAVFSAQNDAVLMYDTGMNVKQVNQVFLSTYGFDPVGLNVKEIIRRLSCRRLDGRTLLLEDQPTPRALRGEKVTSSLFAITLPDGSDRIIETSSGPMLQGDRITGTVTVWHDITEFKRAEEKHRESQERLILAADAGQVGMFDLNMESGELQWTQQHEKIFGYAPTTSITKRTYQVWSERVHPEDLPRVEAHMRHAMEEKVPFDIEYRIIWPDKSVHWVNVSSKYYFDDAGHCKRLMGAVMDITERKQSEERLKELSQRLTYHVDNSPLAVIEWGPDMRLTRWSNMAERIFGWKAEEVIGKRMEDFHWIFVEDTEQVEDVSTELKTGGNLRRFSSNRNYRKDGTVVHCEWYNSSLMDESGKLRSIMSLVLDVTERKQAEKKIFESLKEKEVLLKEIHHRVKNNLQIISSLISLQADSMANEQLMWALGDVRDRVRAIALVHEKLYQTEELARLDFAEYATGLLNYLWSVHDAPIGNVHLSMAFASLILPIEMAVPCGLILNELVCNALKHAFPSGLAGEVAVTLEHDHATGAACLRVRDNGIGLPADLDWRQSPSLGLRLVQILAGQISGTVKTGSGPGTEFQISFNVNAIAS